MRENGFSMSGAFFDPWMPYLKDIARYPADQGQRGGLTPRASAPKRLSPMLSSEPAQGRISVKFFVQGPQHLAPDSSQASSALLLASCASLFDSSASDLAASASDLAASASDLAASASDLAASAASADATSPPDPSRPFAPLKPTGPRSPRAPVGPVLASRVTPEAIAALRTQIAMAAKIRFRREIETNADQILSRIIPGRKLPRSRRHSRSYPEAQPLDPC